MAAASVVDEALQMEIGTVVMILISALSGEVTTSDPEDPQTLHPMVQGYITNGNRLCEELATTDWTTWCSVFEPFFRIKIVQALFWLTSISLWIGGWSAFIGSIVVQKKNAFL